MEECNCDIPCENGKCKYEDVKKQDYIKVEKSENKLLRNFAKALLLGMKIREESFNKKEADRREKEDKYLYFSDLYQISEDVAMKQAFIRMGFEESFAYPFYLALHWYNDLQWWACKILGWDDNDWPDNNDGFIVEK